MSLASLPGLISRRRVALVPLAFAVAYVLGVAGLGGAVGASHFSARKSEEPQAVRAASAPVPASQREAYQQAFERGYAEGLRGGRREGKRAGERKGTVIGTGRGKAAGRRDGKADGKREGAVVGEQDGRAAA